MAKIVIDARESGTSTGRYIDKLVEHLQQLKPDFEISLLAKAQRLDYLRKLAPDFKVLETSYREFTFGEQSGFRRQIQRLKADLVHFGMTQQPVRYRGLTVTTVHDLTTLRFVNPDKNLLVFKFKQLAYGYVVRRAAHKASRIIVPSEFVKTDLVRYTAVDPLKITVIYEAAEPITETAEPVTGLKDQRFIMYVGRPTPHKNLERLIEAFGILKQKNPELMLVLAGKKDANYQRLEQSVQKANKQGVVFTGLVTEGQLRWLYEHCAAYVFPSLSEGFGLPGLEAMTHGAPVVSSNATCLPEIYGDGARYFNPRDVSDMAAAIQAVLSDDKLRDELAKKGAAQVRNYSWRTTAEQTLDVYRDVLDG